MKRYYNHFEKLHPITLIIYFIGVIFLSFMLDEPVLVSINAVCALTICVLSGGWKTPLYALPLMLFVIVLNPLFSHTGSTVLFYINDNAVTKEAVIFGVRTAFTILSALMWFSFLNRSLSSDKFLYVFSRHLPNTALMVSMIFKCTAEFSRQYKNMSSCCESLGFSLKKGSLSSRLKTGALLLTAVVGAGLESSVDTAVSMKSRGYGLSGKSAVKRYFFSVSDALICAAAILGFSGVILLWMMKTNAAVAAVYAVLLNIPFLFNLVKEIKWKLIR